jgi:hypothetical protein
LKTLSFFRKAIREGVGEEAFSAVLRAAFEGLDAPTPSAAPGRSVHLSE